MKTRVCFKNFFFAIFNMSMYVHQIVYLLFFFLKHVLSLSLISSNLLGTLIYLRYFSIYFSFEEMKKRIKATNILMFIIILEMKFLKGNIRLVYLGYLYIFLSIKRFIIRGWIVYLIPHEDCLLHVKDVSNSFEDIYKGMPNYHSFFFCY